MYYNFCWGFENKYGLNTILYWTKFIKATIFVSYDKQSKEF